jgi:hypothetical protein
MKLIININEKSHCFIIFNLCSQNGYSDYEGIVNNGLDLDMEAVVERVKGMGFCIETWNNKVCLAQKDNLYLTIYPSGRIILERVPGNDVNDSLPYFQQTLGFEIDR